MAVSYKKLLHLMIERDITNAQLMRDANISANIITKLKNLSVINDIIIPRKLWYYTILRE